MLKKEFQKRINKAEEYLREYWFRYGVCEALSKQFRIEDPLNGRVGEPLRIVLEGGGYPTVPGLFNKVFAPKRDFSSYMYFLGELTKRNLEKRVIYLRDFEEYMIQTGLYKGIHERLYGE